MSIYTTEIASNKLDSDRPIHLRILKAYELAKPYLKGVVLELGCGEGRGIELIEDQLAMYIGIDKNQMAITELKSQYPQFQFIKDMFPPVFLPDNSVETIISFQVIEHIKKDKEYLQEIYRLLKPGGIALISTPNAPMTLSRNPWHEREYSSNQLEELCENVFDDVFIQGISGNQKVMEYYYQNKRNVDRIMRFDILNLEQRLPNAVLRLPYEILNRMNRNQLQKQSPDLTSGISLADFTITEASEGIDLFAILKKL